MMAPDTIISLSEQENGQTSGRQWTMVGPPWICLECHCPSDLESVFSVLLVCSVSPHCHQECGKTTGSSVLFYHTKHLLAFLIF